MKNLIESMRKAEFEFRMFISLGIVSIFCLTYIFGFPDAPSNMVLLGNLAGISAGLAIKIGFSFLAFLMLVASLLRMWGGTALSSPRVMSFKIQKEVLITDGPYQLTRHPIYLADFLCMCGFGLIFPWFGIALPVLLFVHYTQLIIYEEKAMEVQFGESFTKYQKEVPRFIPNGKSLRRFGKVLKTFHINKDGFRHNAQYVLLVPGFMVAAWTGNWLYALLIGIPGILDWAIVHTIIGLNPKKEALKQQKAAALQGEKVFQDIIYAQCWEDPEIDRKAFQMGPEDVVFSITSGGCNTLAFLVDNPQRVIALDLSPYQNYLLELKMAAFRELSYAELLEFVGVSPSSSRMAYYNRLKGYLKPASLAYWDSQPEKIEQGIIHCGRYEWYMRLLRRTLVFLVGRKLPRAFFECQTKEARRYLFNTRWDNLRWKLFTRIFLSRRMMSLLFTKAFFEQVQGSFSFGVHFREQVKNALISLPLKENYFLAYILLGHYYSNDFLPVYLQKENYEIIKNRLDRIEVVTGNCLEYFRSLPPNAISCFNFSNIFEWINPAEFEQLLTETIRVAREGSILTYRNLLVPRSRPASLATWIKPQEQFAHQLLAEDRSFVYRAYIVEEITKRHGLPNQDRSERAGVERISRPSVSAVSQ